MIRIVITQYEKNPEFFEYIKKYSGGYTGNQVVPSEEVIQKKLETEITEDQFNLIRRSILENF